MTNAKVVGLQDSSIFPRHLVRSETVAATISDNCTDPLDSSHVYQAVPSPNDSSDTFPEHAVPHCLDCAMDPRNRRKWINHGNRVRQTVQARRHSHFQHIETHHLCRRCNFAQYACTICWGSGNSWNVGPVRRVHFAW